MGQENKGWDYAKFLLGHERTNIAGVGASKRELGRLKDIARQEMKNGKPLLEDPLFAARVAQVETDLARLRIESAEAAAEAEGPWVARATSRPDGRIPIERARPVHQSAEPGLQDRGTSSFKPS